MPYVLGFFRLGSLRGLSSSLLGVLVGGGSLWYLPPRLGIHVINIITIVDYLGSYYYNEPSRAGGDWPTEHSLGLLREGERRHS